MVAATLSFSSTAHSQNAEKKVGVAVSAVINTNLETGIKVSAALGKALSKRLEVTVVSGAEAQTLLPAAAQAENCLGDTACLTAAGQALGVDELLMLIIVDIGGNYKIEATWIDVKSGDTALRPAIDAPTSADLLSKSLENQVGTLLPDAALRMIDAPVEPPTKHDDLVEKDPQEVTAPTVKSEKSWNGTSKALLWGGVAAVAIGASRFTFRLIDCKGFETGMNCSKKSGIDSAADVVGTLGVISITAAVYLYLSSEETETIPVAFGVQKDSVAFTYQGRF